MLAVEGLTVRFGGVAALDGVDLALAEGEVVGLIGPNGSGKTTLINALSGVSGATGRARFRGTDLIGLAPERIARLGIARTFQNLRLYRRMTVLDNVAAALAAEPGLGRAAARARAERLLGAVGLADQADSLAGALPLALQRRLELARALARDPPLLLLDEPAGGMTPAETEEMTVLIAGHALPGRAVLVVEHKMALIAALCPRLVALNFGRVIAEGAPAEVLATPAVVEAYLGPGAGDA